MTARPVLVTRPSGQGEELVALLADRGVASVAVPTVEIDASSTEADLDAMVRRLPGADWLVLTSANGAAALRARLFATGDAIPVGVRVAAVGPATAEALARGGIPVDHVPDTYRTVAIAAGLGAVEGRRVVLARADAASPELRDALVERGAAVEEVVAYRTIEAPTASRGPLAAALRRGIGAVAFTSPSTVRGFVRLLDSIGPDVGDARILPTFSIGPVTAEAAAAAGLRVAAVADPHTAPALAGAIAARLSEGDQR